MAVGALRGWLFQIGPTTGSAVLPLVVIAAVVGTLLVIPTGGEIPTPAGCWPPASSPCSDPSHRLGQGRTPAERKARLALGASR
jgi:hypothetical protein